MSDNTDIAVVNPGLQQFRQYVTGWIELDNMIKKLQSTLKEKRDLKEKVASRIMDFMTRHDVEDVNMRDVKLRYKVVQSKGSLTQREIKERLMAKIPESQSLVEEAFHERTMVNRPTLRRLKMKTVPQSVAL